MRNLVVVLLTVALTGCITVSVEPSPTPTPTLSAQPTNPPEPTATPEPTSSPTPSPTPSPTNTPDPDATPRPTVVDVLPFLTSNVTIVNLSEQSLELTVTLLDPDSDGEFVIGTFNLQPSQVTSQAVIPTRLRLQFELDAGADVGTCTIDVADGEQLQFAVIESGIAMASSGAQPADADEMLVATSSRCHAGDST